MIPTIYNTQPDPREKWHNAYIHELLDLYNIFMLHFENAFPNVEVCDELAFHQFSRLIFHTSSGYISEYTKALQS
jgi:hypothetical protein